MTNETRNRIRAYMEELPHMKEKVFGALLMLVIAATVVATSSYAWVALSRSPEVSDITTTLAANGALEIALSRPDGKMPEEFDIDESLDGDPSVVVSNLQWGNLVNLSDPVYGIDNLALRPAQLNTANLLYNPLWGATYGEDGRITELNSSYTYTKYDGNQFIASKEYGVRAISSYTTATSDSTVQALNEKINQVGTAKEKVAAQYGTVISKFSTLGNLITRVAQDKVNGTQYAVDPDQTDSNLAPYLSSIRDLYIELKKTMDLQKEAYVALANLQLYQWSKANEQEFVATTWAALEKDYTKFNAANASTPSKSGIISLTGLTQFISDYNALAKDLSYLEKYVAAYNDSGAEYYWAHGGDSGFDIVNMITRLIDYGSMYLIIDGEEVPISNIQSKATSLIGGGTYPIYTKKGILQRFEQSALGEAARMNGNAQCNIKIQAKVGITMTVNVNGKAYTTATGASYFDLDLAATQNKSMDATDKIAEDTYGLAVDLWVRTNAEQTCLTLEGATSTDEQGNIVSYDGINRVWGSTGEAVLTTDSTTQGGGSCYVYYADTPEDMARSLELLNAMKVAFVDAYGNLLATAEMDTSHPWAVNGRVTVPLVLDNQTKTTYTYTDAENAVLTGYAVTTLYTDEAVRITAIVYLDGTYLTNDHVLAAAEIQGALNIQFGSSTNLKTVGSNELIDDTRSVSAIADKYELDYDTAEFAEDLTTTVTLNVEGTQPNRITAFFVRAINSTQGTREETMTFEKQPDGTWTHMHRFAAPGTYYLRHVRMDGVDYALHEPLKITVSGFALSNVTWNAGGDSVTVRTSDNIYSVDVSAAFATTDTAKMPVSVQIRFTRDDGNVVNVPLTYNSSTGQWTGKAEFSVSGTYTMEYIVYTIKGDDVGRYKDLDNFRKTLDLSLGMYATVTDLSGGLVQEYEDGKSYPKEIAVRIYNNAGTELTDLTDLKLYYSNGGSATNTINTDLSWDEGSLFGYTGTLMIVSPGRYQFSYVELGNQQLRLAKESPVYTVISPDPPIYDADSSCTENNENGIQMVPYSNDAKISGLLIENSSAADVTVVVYSEVAQKYYELSRADNKLVVSGDSWTIKLPTYTLDLDADGNALPNATYTQEGNWSLVLVKISNCYDQYGEFRNSERPIMWAGADEISNTYLTNGELTADASYDFSALATKVSTTVKVSMSAETTALGGENADFMTTFYANDLDGRVMVTDNDGNLIPSSKVSDVTLNLRYTAPDTDQYGYKVLPGANRTYALPMEYIAEDGCYKISSTEYWQYVGEYTVTSLSMTIGGVSKTYYPSDGIGIPAGYTVTTAGPGADDITMTVSQNQTSTVLGKTGNNVTGTFLQAHSPNVSAKFGLSGVTGTNYVDMSNLVTSVNLVLTYQDGDSAPNGGYTWAGDSPYENITLAMTSDADGSYKSGSTPLLAGTYSVKVVAAVGEHKIEQEKSPIEVYSKKPTLKVTAVSPDSSTSFVVNTDTGETMSYDDVRNTYGVSVQNYISATGDLANVYIAAVSESQSFTTGETTESFDMVRYTLPKVTLQLGNLDNSGFASARAVVPNAANSDAVKTYTFTPGSMTKENEIGGKAEKEYQAAEGGCSGGDIVLKYDVQYNAGEQVISTVTMTDSSDFAYNVTLENPVTIREENVAPPAISYAAVSGYNTFATQVSETGDSFQVTLPTAASFGTQTGETSEIVGGQGWGTPVSDTTSGKYCYVETVGDVKTNPVTTGSGCNASTTNYMYYTFKYYQFERHQYKYEQTSGTKFYSVVKGLTGWQIGDQIYAPGATITVEGVWTAIPVVETINKTFLREEVVTMVHTTIKDIPAETPSFTQDGPTTTHKDEASARAAHTLPEGYVWYNNDNHFDATKVVVNETQDGEDYKKPNS